MNRYEVDLHISSPKHVVRCIQSIRQCFGLGLKDAKDLFDSIRDNNFTPVRIIINADQYLAVEHGTYAYTNYESAPYYYNSYIYLSGLEILPDRPPILDVSANAQKKQTL